jgi:hypothetical protein
MNDLTIDLTPEVLKTPEGVQRVNAALGTFHNTTAEVANLATSFLEEWGVNITNIMRVENPALYADYNELQEAVKDRAKAQEALLRSIAGR